MQARRLALCFLLASLLLFPAWGQAQSPPAGEVIATAVPGGVPAEKVSDHDLAKISGRGPGHPALALNRKIVIWDEWGKREIAGKDDGFACQGIIIIKNGRRP